MHRLAGRGARAPAGGSRRSSSAACASTRPESAVSMPARMRSSVLLPVPFGATTPIRLRGPTVKLTSSSTTCGRTTCRCRGRRGRRANCERRRGRGGVERDTAAPARVERTGGLGVCRVATSPGRIAPWTPRTRARFRSARARRGRRAGRRSGRRRPARGRRVRRCAARRRRARALRPRGLRLLGGGVSPRPARRLPLHRRSSSAARRGASVTVADCRFDDANFRMAQLDAGAIRRRPCARAPTSAARASIDVQFPACDLAGADVSNAQCSDVDLRGARLDGLRGVGSLRGATIGVDQLFGLAPGLAAAVGLRVLAEETEATHSERPRARTQPPLRSRPSAVRQLAGPPVAAAPIRDRRARDRARVRARAVDQRRERQLPERGVAIGRRLSRRPLVRRRARVRAVHVVDVDSGLRGAVRSPGSQA